MGSCIAGGAYKGWHDSRLLHRTARAILNSKNRGLVPTFFYQWPGWVLFKVQVEQSLTVASTAGTGGAQICCFHNMANTCDS